MRAITLSLILLIGVFAHGEQKSVKGGNQGMKVCGSGGAACPVLDLANGTNWTLLLRFRFDPAMNFGAAHDLFAQDTFNGTAFTCAGVILRVAPGGLLSVRVGILGGLSQTVIFNSGSAVSLGTWENVALTHDSSHNWILYINGAVAGSTTSTPTMNSSCETFISTIAGASDCGGSEVGCYFNDVTFFSSIISLNDITAWTSGTRPNMLSVQPVAWYPMEGGFCSATTDPDSSGNRHTLALGRQPAPGYCSPASTNGNVIPPTGEATH